MTVALNLTHQTSSWWVLVWWVRAGVINRGANLFSRPIHCACIASSLQAHALQRLSVGYECMRAAEFRKIRTLEPKFYLSVMHARETDEILQQMHACCLLFPAHVLLISWFVARDLRDKPPDKRCRACASKSRRVAPLLITPGPTNLLDQKFLKDIYSHEPVGRWGGVAPQTAEESVRRVS